ncbi:hypothetical protein EAH_00048800 [Eimeria acervulina]|uniref:Uncharacterized protein n=1 Tax=Eimeria acervulina TaxID=5801 RepID=U6GY18_EIMAC|nr:hypothetical protein EAH_00048800 [Eimeria acervulina]CDI84123.1 hypothetical protein EAH_00048800 [Eimeria acervulina]
MPENNNIFLYNATPSSASAFASSELPTLESSCARPVKLRARAPCPSSRLRLVLGTIASSAAVVLLVFFCSRVYERRAVQGLRSRRLASVGNSEASVGNCCDAGDGEERRRQGPRASKWPAGEEFKWPLKKRFTARVAGTGDGGAVGNPQQQEQRYLQELPVAPPGLSAGEAPPKLERRGFSELPVHGILSSAQARVRREFDAARGLQRLSTQKHPPGHYIPDVRQTIPLEVRMQLQLHLLQRQLQREGRHHRQQQLHLQQQHDQHELYHQQQQLHWKHLLWRVQQQQQPLIQQQQQGHLMQQQQQSWHQQPELPLSLLQQQEQEDVIQDQDHHQMEEQESTPQDDGKQLHRKRKREREQQVELDAPKEQQHQVLQPTGRAPESLLEDAWIAPGPPRPETPQPSSSRQALQVPVAAGDTPPSTSVEFGTQVAGGLPLAPPAASLTIPDEGASGDAADLAPISGAPAANTATRCVLSDGRSSPGPSTAATEGRGVEAGVPSTALVGGGFGEGGASAAGETASAAEISASGGTLAPVERATAPGGAKAAAAAGAGSLIPAPTSIPASSTLLGMRTAALVTMREHPFVRLPKQLLVNSPGSIVVNFEDAVNSTRASRHALPLLLKARWLLSKHVLFSVHLKELVEVVEELIGNAAHYHAQDVSHHQTYRAVGRLGMRFLVLDVIVSTLLILGQKVDPGRWQRFTNAIRHAAPQPPQTANFSKRAHFYLSLAKELSRAIQILKTGKRPAPSELLLIKRMLFCSSFSPSRFKGRDFDPWRQDNIGGADGP